MHTHKFSDNWTEIQTNSRKRKDGYYTSYEQRECLDCRAKEVRAVTLKKKPDHYDH